MRAESEAQAATECPAWCGVKHEKNGAKYHTHCVGEVRLREGNVELVVTRRNGVDGVEVAYYPASGAPAIAFLGKRQTAKLRDSLDEALRAFSAA